MNIAGMPDFEAAPAANAVEQDVARHVGAKVGGGVAAGVPISSEHGESPPLAATPVRNGLDRMIPEVVVPPGRRLVA